MQQHSYIDKHTSSKPNTQTLSHIHTYYRYGNTATHRETDSDTHQTYSTQSYTPQTHAHTVSHTHTHRDTLT